MTGNLTLAYSADRGTSYIYKYDHHNRLTGVYDSTGTTRKAAFTWDALGRRIEFVNDVLAGTPTTRYYYDGVNEVAEYDGSGSRSRTYVHGISYVDERLMMHDDAASRPYYYAVDRMYNVVMLIDRAGAIVERYCYDAYGRPFIRESCGRGDMDDDTDMDSTDDTRFAAALAGSIWDPRADLDDDGDVDGDDQDLYDAKYGDWDWDPPGSGPTVAQAFSDVGNPYMFQGVPHFALDTAAEATEGRLLLNHHRARFDDPAIGRWLTRDPLHYCEGAPVDRPSLSRSEDGRIALTGAVLPDFPDARLTKRVVSYFLAIQEDARHGFTTMDASYQYLGSNALSATDAHGLEISILSPLFHVVRCVTTTYTDCELIATVELLGCEARCAKNNHTTEDIVACQDDCWVGHYVGAYLICTVHTVRVCTGGLVF